MVIGCTESCANELGGQTRGLGHTCLPVVTLCFVSMVVKLRDVDNVGITGKKQ